MGSRGEKLFHGLGAGLVIQVSEIGKGVENEVSRFRPSSHGGPLGGGPLDVLL